MEAVVQKKVRESGIELLRIILMLQVIFLHVCTKGQYSSFGRGHLGEWHELFYWCIWLMCRCPVYLYFLISGYFSITSNRTLGDIKGKALRIYMAMLFYSILLPLIGWIFGWWEMTWKTVMMMFFPNITRVWYFMTLYLIVLFLSPYLNKCLTKISKKEYGMLVGFLMILLSILPMLTRFEPFASVVNLEQIVSTDGGKSLYGVIFMYILGGYIRLYVKTHEKAKLRYLAAFIGLLCINVTLRYVVPGYKSTVGTFDNCFIILQGISLFLFFRDLHFKSVIVNQIAALNLGVYMVHEHLLFRWIIWDDIFPITREKSFYMTWKYPIKIFLICVAIFTGCAIIEQIRVWIFSGVNTAVRVYKDKKV